MENSIEELDEARRRVLANHEAKQTPEAVDGDVISRAQAPAEMRSGYAADARQIVEPEQVPRYNNSGNDYEDVEQIIINGSGNLTDAPCSDDAPQPEVISAGVGSYEPQLANKDETQRTQPQILKDRD